MLKWSCDLGGRPKVTLWPKGGTHLDLQRWGEADMYSCLKIKQWAYTCNTKVHSLSHKLLKRREYIRGGHKAGSRPHVFFSPAEWHPQATVDISWAALLHSPTIVKNFWICPCWDSHLKMLESMFIWGKNICMLTICDLGRISLWLEYL